MQENRIGQNIAFLRKRYRITQEQLARALSISKQAVSKWECGICLPDTLTMPEIAGFFRVSIDFLYNGEAGAVTESAENDGLVSCIYCRRCIYACKTAENVVE